jgi:amino acid transporter
VSAAAALMIALPGSFIYAVKLTVITRVIVYASTCAALPILRRRDRSPFEVPGGVLISLVCVALCLWLLVSSEWREARDVTIAVGIGLVVYFLTRIRSGDPYTPVGNEASGE